MGKEPMSPAAQVWRSVTRPSVRRLPAQREPRRSSPAITEQLEAAISSVVAETYPHVWEALTEIGRRHIVHEIAEAYLAAPPEDRDVAAYEVMEAWHRTWLVRQDPGYPEMLERAATIAEERGERAYTFDELDARLGL